jgi:hypothetical protein
MRMQAWILKVSMVSVLILGSLRTRAWVYPEHRLIALMAIQNLNPEYRTYLEGLWSEARTGHENRLTSGVIDPDQGIRPGQLDYASWTAIAGDHSCSPRNMLDIVLQSDWILKVADIAAQLKTDLSNAKTRSQQINAIRNSDIRLQRADLEYATRAGSNNVHFLLARPEINTDAAKYLKACLSPGAEINALGVYSWFHISALFKASRYANEQFNPQEKSALIRAALADEAFALHFLEDAYAAGHIAGTWGDASVRKGTHDYYNEHGLEVVTWDSKRMVLRGDAYMRPEDAEIAAANVRLSLEQFLNAAQGSLVAEYKSDNISDLTQPDSFSVCRYNLMPSIEKQMPSLKIDVTILTAVLIQTPVPGLATGYGELPRFQSELGVFFGISTSLNGSGISGGFGADQTEDGAVGGIEANVRFGFGLEGVLNQAGDGLIFLQAGWRRDGTSTNQIVNNSAIPVANSITAAIPGRSAYNFRIRLPFWLIPGDLIFAAPLVYLFSPQKAGQMAVIAANGGLIPWQSGIATRFGRFQFVLGREVGVSLYGLGSTKDAIFVQDPNANNSLTILSYKSTQLDFPVLEYLPFPRSFSQTQSSSLLFQFFWGVDIPYGTTVISPAGSPVPPLKNVYLGGLRIIFNWRHYLH